MKRVEVLWHYYCQKRGRHVEEWLPGVLIETRGNGRLHVRTNCGRETNDAAPECVREAS